MIILKKIKIVIYYLKIKLTISNKFYILLLYYNDFELANNLIQKLKTFFYLFIIITILSKFLIINYYK